MGRIIYVRFGRTVVVPQRVHQLHGVFSVQPCPAHEADHAVGQLILQQDELTVLLHGGTQTRAVPVATFHDDVRTIPYGIRFKKRSGIFGAAV